MTTHPVIARNNVTRQSIVSRRTRIEDAVRLLRASGSPRAFLNTLAMTRVSENPRQGQHPTLTSRHSDHPSSDFLVQLTEFLWIVYRPLTAFLF